MLMTPHLGRRRMLQGLLTGGALVLGARFQTFARASLGADASSPAFVTAWVRVAADNSVTLIASQSEMGQGTTATLAGALADELFLPVERVSIEFAPFGAAYRDPVYGWMFTGNSQSISSFYGLMRRMGAAAREMLLTAAAERLQVPAGQLSMRDGFIQDASSKRSVRFGDIAGDAAKLPVPEMPRLRADPALMGRAVPRWDIPSKVDGSAIFGIDVKVPDMLLAAIGRAPRFGGKFVTYDSAAIRAKPGVVAIVELPDGLAVVARTYWQARRALDSGQIVWTDSGSRLASGARLPPMYAEKLSSGNWYPHKVVGDAAKTIGASRNTVDAVYQIPFQAHATMEPMNCTAHVVEGRCEIWAPTQGVEMAQNVAVQITGLPTDRIHIHRTLIGGGFGRRLLADFIKQTLMIALQVKRPVKLIWSREEDMRHDFYRPAMLHAISGSVDETGSAVALAHRVVSPSHMLYIFPRGMFPQVKDWTDPAAPPEKMDTMAVEGLLEIPYAIPHQAVQQHRLELDVPVSVWRTTGHGPNNFVLESFVDELAHAAGTDPLVFRRSLLRKNPRARKVLDLAAEKAGWDRPAAKGTARGIALASAFGGLIANVVELSVTGGKIKLHRIVSAVDCGRTLDPGIAESNILGGIVWGLSGMRTEMTFDNGAAAVSNFDGFEPLRLWETPHCEVHFIESGEQLGGTGELGPVPVHAAVCNAVFAATGKRIRTLPLSRSNMSFA